LSRRLVNILVRLPQLHGKKFLLLKKEHVSMNWDQVECNWKMFKGKVRQKWGMLTNDELDVIQGRRDQLIGKIQERYGLEREQAEKEVDDFLKAA